MLAGNFSGHSPKNFEVSLCVAVPVRLVRTGEVLDATTRMFSGRCVGTKAASDVIIVEFDVVDVLEDSDSEEEPDVEDDRFGADIVYCLAPHIKMYYMENAQKREDDRSSGLDSAVLIVDEVDDLVCSGTYIYSQYSAKFRRCDCTLCRILQLY